MMESMFKSRHAQGIRGEHYRICTPGHATVAGDEFGGEDQRSGQSVSMLRLAEGLIASERAREKLTLLPHRFLDLHHPGLLACYWSGMDADQQYWLVQAVFPGKNQASAGGSLEQSLVQKLLLDLGEVLLYLHQQGLLHQCLIPSQLSLSPLNEVCLAGLALGQLLLPNRLLQVVSDQDALEFLAPEQRQGLSIDARADQYSLAACALWLLTGQKPNEVSWSQLSQQRPAADELLQTLRKALSPQPEQRFPDIESFCLACQGLKPQSSLLFRLSPSITALVLLAVLVAIVLLWIRQGQPGLEPNSLSLAEQPKISSSQRQAIPLWRDELQQLYQEASRPYQQQLARHQQLERRIAELSSGRRANAERQSLLAQRQQSSARLELLSRLQLSAPDDAMLQQLLAESIESEHYDLTSLNAWRQKLKQRQRDLDAIDLLLSERAALAELQQQWKKLQQQASNPRELRNWIDESAKDLDEKRFVLALQKTQQLNALYRSLLSRLPDTLALREQSLRLQAEWQALSYRLALMTPEARQLQDLMAHAELKFSQGQLDDLADIYQQLLQGYRQQLNLSQRYREAENQYLRDKQQWLDYARRNQLSLELPAELQLLEQQASNLTGKELESLTTSYYPRLSQAYRDWLVQLKQQNRKIRLAQWNRAQGIPAPSAAIPQQERLLSQFKNKTVWLLQIQSSMVDISGGSFFMGGISRNLRPGTESYSVPKHAQRVQPFRISDHEVTFAEYDFYARSNKLPLPEDEGFGRGNRPVINLNYAQVQAYIRWLNQQGQGGFRLPTETEWEFVAWAGRNHSDQWRLNPDENLPTAHCQSCLASNQFGMTLPAASLLANPWGLYDLFGNVAEWTADCWHPNYQHFLAGAAANSVQKDKDCQMQVIRGGSYQDKQEWLNPLQRDPIYRQDALSTLGFRLAQSLSKP